MTEPVFLATQEGADEAVARGRRRRVTSGLAALSAAGAVTAVVVLAPWQDLGVRDTLSPAKQPTPVVSDARERPRPVPSASPTSSVAARPQPPLASRLQPTAAPPTARASRDAAPATRPGRAPAPSPITRGTARLPTGDLCGQDEAAATGWCTRYTGPTTATRGEPVTLSMELCRLEAFPAASVSFATTREISLRVADWEAGRGTSYRSPGRTVTIQPGSCLTWASTWDTRDRDGYLALPGEYTIGFGVETSGATWQQAGPTLTLRE